MTKTMDGIKVPSQEQLRVAREMVSSDAMSEHMTDGKIIVDGVGGCFTCRTQAELSNYLVDVFHGLVTALDNPMIGLMAGPVFQLCTAFLVIGIVAAQQPEVMKAEEGEYGAN